ncbi:MAG TPA: hypothetical protein VMH83_11870, partial [Candidatus Acidoferrum sp.]|nr:hypothetical protein [Candidatus Acidoferrum sp.]
MRITVKSLIIVTMSALALPALAQSQRFNCDRACLAKVADGYFAAMAAHDPSKLVLAPNVKYTDTGKVKKLGDDGLWKTATGLPRYRLNLYDPETGGIGIHAVVPERGLDTLLSLRLKVENQKVTEVEAMVIAGDSKIVGHQPEDLTQPSRLWTRTIPVVERNSRFEIIAAAEAYFRGFETNGTSQYIAAPLLPETDRRENGILYTNTSIGKMKVSTARSGFDAGNFKGMQVRDRRYPVVDSETGAVMSLVRFGDPMGELTKAGLPVDKNGNPQQAPDILVGASFVSEIFCVSQGKIAEINALWIP